MRPKLRLAVSRAGLTRVELLAVVLALGLLAALMLPSVRNAREAARRNSCTCHGKQYGLALQNHHDAKQHLPPLSTTNVTEASPGSADAAQPAGFSWLVAILPYMEERELYKQISEASNDFSRPAFAETITANGAPMSPANPHLSTIDRAGVLRCPSYAGPIYSSAPQYAAFQTRNSSGGATVTGCPVCTYAATPTSHLACLTARESDATAEPPNGVIIPPSPEFPEGINFREITDGLSKTIIVAETREERYAAWFDGTVNYVVAADPNMAQVARDPNNGYWTFMSGGTALNVGPSPDPKVQYRTPANFANGQGQAWSWGPSSYHSRGVVIHLYADGGVRNITDDVDPTLYLRLFTRAGGEPVLVPGLE